MMVESKADPKAVPKAASWALKLAALLVVSTVGTWAFLLVLFEGDGHFNVCEQVKQIVYVCLAD